MVANGRGPRRQKSAHLRVGAAQPVVNHRAAGDLNRDCAGHRPDVGVAQLRVGALDLLKDIPLDAQARVGAVCREYSGTMYRYRGQKKRNEGGTRQEAREQALALMESYGSWQCSVPRRVVPHRPSPERSASSRRPSRPCRRSSSRCPTRATRGALPSGTSWPSG